MNYRAKFKKHYGISFGKDYEVHHIDLNHYNDDFENLMLLPRKLHRKYHFALEKMPKENGNLAINTKICGAVGFGSKLNLYALTAFKEFLEIYEECQVWKDFKAYLDGELPNIHGIYIKGINK